MVAYSNGNVVWAYGSGPAANTADHCLKVVVSDFTPPPFSRETNNVEVAPGSNFSFIISKDAKVDSIKVSVKGEQIPTTVSPQQNGTQVKGKLPPGIKGKYIRIDIAAKGPNECTRTDGWLLKVGN